MQHKSPAWACDPASLTEVFHRLIQAYGPQHWWPGESVFEIMVGAILTQNTAWTNVEHAISRLRADAMLDPETILSCEDTALAERLRPSGYFNVKTRRVKAFCRFYVDAGGYDALQAMDTVELRRRLLAIHGIGPETADDILLYAFNRPVFVIDTYTRRLFSRLGLVPGDATYEQLGARFEALLPADASLFNEYHALIVRHAKELCKVKPRCDQCFLVDQCCYASSGRGRTESSKV